MDKVRYGVVGAGWISQIAFMPSVCQTSNSSLSAIVTGNAENAAKLAEFYGIEHLCDYDGFDALLAADVIDAVYIGLPNSLHAEYAIRAAEAGKHVLVEKPLALTVEECEAMIAAAEENGVWLMTAYRLHNDPGTVDALERIRQGAIGEPRFFSSVFSFQSGPDNHRLSAEHWGGPLQDIGVYCLNAARHAFSAEPVEVFAMRGHGDGDPRFSEVEETIAVTLRFPGERFAQFIASFGADMVDSYRIVGTKGDLTVEPGYRFETDVALRLRQNDALVDARTAPPCDHFGAQTEYFSDCILNGTRPESDGQEGLADVAVLRAIERAAEAGQPQTLELAPVPTHPGPDTVRNVARTDRRLVL